MRNKPNTCFGCSLHLSGKGFCPDSLVEKEEYVIFGEAPGTTEIAKEAPFEGKAGFVLRNWLIRSVPEVQLALERKAISLRNILKCLPPDNKGRPYPTGEIKNIAEAHCSQYHAPITAPTVILAGDVPQRYFFKEELEAEDAAARRLGRDAPGVMGRVGREYIKDGRRWVFAPHPAFILRQPSLAAHGQMAIKIASNVDKVAEPDYISWTNALEELKHASNE